MFCLSVFHGVLTLSVLYIDTSVKSCRPTEEHQPATLTYTWLTPNDKGLEVSWFKDSTVVSKCNSTPKCVDFFHNFSRTTAKGLNGTGVLISVSIDNVTLSASGVWILQYVGLQRNDVLMICHLNVYSRGKNVNCNYNLYSGSLIAQCQVEKIYPKALCKAYVKNKENLCADTHIMNVTNEELSKSLIYFTSTCSVAVNYQVYMKWNLDLIVIIYPNVTGDETDVQYGINETIPVEIKPTANDFSKTCIDDVDTKKCKCYTVVTDRGNTGRDGEHSNKSTGITSASSLSYEPEDYKNDALLVKCIYKEIFDIIVICLTISEYQLRDCQFNIQANKVTQQLKGNTTANPSMSKLKGTNVQQCHLRLPWKRKQEYLCEGYVQMILSSPVHENKLIVAMGNFSFTIRSNRTEELSEDEEESFHKWLIIGLTVVFMISFLFLVTFMLCKKRGFLRARKMEKRINKVSAVGENVCLEDISRSKVSLHIYETVLEDDESLVSKRKWICL